MSLCTSIPATRSYSTFMRGHLLQRHPPPDGNRRAARQSPGQYRRLTHAHAAATGVTRQGALAPISVTASNGPSASGDDVRHATPTMHLPPRPPLPEHGGIPRPPATRTLPTAGGDPVFASHASATQRRMISQLWS